MLVLAGTVHAYTVSGLVEFAYRDYETKVGQQKTSWSEFVQSYSISAETFVFDPRLVVVRGGIGYAITTHSGSANTDVLSYNVAADFFTGMKYSFGVDAAKTTSTVSPVGSVQYDLTTTTYAAKAALDLARPGGNGNNNNNNNNGNNFRNRSSGPFPLPFITLEQRHTEADSTSPVYPQSETRDETKGVLVYKLAENLTVNMNAGLEKYNDGALNQSYDTKSGDLLATWLVTPRSDFNVTGRLYQRDTNNITGFLQEEKSNALGFTYNVAEVDRIAQNYWYNVSSLRNPVASQDAQNGGAKIWYRVDESLRLFAGLNYGESDYVQFATFTAPEQDYKITTGSADVGAAYSKIYAPEFMRPFLFHTDYDFFSGFSHASSTSAAVAGNGTIYGNNLALGVLSNGWVNENLTLDYRFSNRRDSSPAAIDLKQNSFIASLSTRRITKVVIGLTANYTNSTTSSNVPNNFTALVANSQQSRRQFSYNVNADYTPTDYLIFSGGATRSRYTSQFQTLSTLGAPLNSSSDDLDFYASALFNYNFTRQLDYHINLRHDYRVTELAVNTRYTQDEFRTWLNYRIRMIYLSLEYRLREWRTSNSPDTTEQYIFTKLSRPF